MNPANTQPPGDQVTERMFIWAGAFQTLFFPHLCYTQFCWDLRRRVGGKLPPLEFKAGADSSTGRLQTYLHVEESVHIYMGRVVSPFFFCQQHPIISCHWSILWSLYDYLPLLGWNKLFRCYRLFPDIFFFPVYSRFWTFCAAMKI